jgi:hypothetical protein
VHHQDLLPPQLQQLENLQAEVVLQLADAAGCTYAAHQQQLTPTVHHLQLAQPGPSL